MGGMVKKVALVGKAATFVVGLAVILALSVGVASTALAGTGVGATFNLGKVNTVGAISKLAGSVAGPSLQIDNNSANDNATALDLQVEAGKAPMKVNSAAVVANLNADKVDGKDASGFFSGATYDVAQSTIIGPAGNVNLQPSCDQGDVALSGGVQDLNLSRIQTSIRNSTGSWFVVLVNTSSNFSDGVVAEVVCADLGTPHQQ